MKTNFPKAPNPTAGGKKAVAGPVVGRKGAKTIVPKKEPAADTVIPQQVVANVEAPVQEPKLPLRPSLEFRNGLPIPIDCNFRDIAALMKNWPLKDFPTPLLLDQTEKTDTFLVYASPPLDCITLNLKGVLVRSLQLEDKSPESRLNFMAEEVRRLLVNGLKYGRPVCLSFQDSAFSLNNIGKKYNLSFVGHSGSELMDEKGWTPLVTEEDKKPYGVFVPRDGFRIIATSRFSIDDFEEFFRENIPLANFLPIRIVHEAE